MTTTDRAAALVRNVRAQGGTILEARRLLEALATDDEQRLREARQRREDDLLAIDLGFGSADALGFAVAESHGIASGGVFPQDASTSEPRGVRAALREMECERLAEEASDDVTAALLVHDAREDHRAADLAESLGGTADELDAMLEGGPQLHPDVAPALSDRKDLCIAETIGVPAKTLAEALDEVFAP